MNQAEAEYEGQPRPQKGLWGRLTGFTDRLIGQDSDEEEADVEEHQQASAPSAPAVQTRPGGGSVRPATRPVTALRLEPMRRTHITVRRAVHSFDDARRAADGLKEGQQQIVNLEQTPADMAERITDFLNGATYALEGSVEKIGEQVYLFTPASVSIDVEDKTAAPSAITRPAFLGE